MYPIVNGMCIAGSWVYVGAHTGTTGFAIVLDELCWLSASKMWINTWCVERRTRVNSHLNGLINNFHLNRVQFGRFSQVACHQNTCTYHQPVPSTCTAQQLAEIRSHGMPPGTSIEKQDIRIWVSFKYLFTLIFIKQNQRWGMRACKFEQGRNSTKKFYKGKKLAFCSK